MKKRLISLGDTIMDDYELVPEEELNKLRHEIEQLKGKDSSTSSNPDSKELYNQIFRLSELIKSASQSVSEEDDLTAKIYKNLIPLVSKVEILVEQNKKIASGILAVADMVREDIPELKEDIRKLKFMFKDLNQNISHVSKMEKTGIDLLRKRDNSTNSTFNSSQPNFQQPPQNLPQPQNMDYPNMSSRSPITKSNFGDHFSDFNDLPPLPSERKKKGLFGLK